MFGKLFGKGKKTGKKSVAKQKSPSPKLRVERKGTKANSLSSASAPSEPPTKGVDELTPDDIRAIQDALKSARDETLDSIAPPPQEAAPRRAQSPASRGESRSNVASPQDRAQLIRTAMTVYKHKQAALSGLDPRELAKLRSLAEEMLGVGNPPSPSNSKKNN